MCEETETFIHCRWGIQNGTPILEDKLVLFYQTKHTLDIQSSNCTSCYIHKGVEVYGIYQCTLSNLHSEVYRSFILIYQNLKATKTSLIRWYDNNLGVVPENVLFSAKKEMSYEAIKRQGRNLNAYY